jgi:sulfide:quinone oxidoreductase
VVIVGGGVAALEAALALGELARERTDVTVLAPNPDFVYRPLSVREPFAQGEASRYELAPIVRAAGARLLADELAWIDPPRQEIHTKSELALGYDVLVLALGAHMRARYKHAIKVDDRHMDELLHGIV